MASSSQWIDRMIRAGLLHLIRFYQWCISPLFPPACRFYPSCSQYAADALRQFGLWHGLRLSFLRLLRCHPLSQGGYDPLPSTLNRSFHGK